MSWVIVNGISMSTYSILPILIWARGSSLLRKKLGLSCMLNLPTIYFVYNLSCKYPVFWSKISYNVTRPSSNHIQIELITHARAEQIYIFNRFWNEKQLMIPVDINHEYSYSCWWIFGTCPFSIFRNTDLKP